MCNRRAQICVILRIDKVPNIGNFDISKIAAICGKFHSTSHHEIFINVPENTFLASGYLYANES